MRLSPRSIFLGVVVFGLPFAVILGWAIGNPAAPLSTPMPGGAGGAGGFGTAPTIAGSPSSGVIGDSWAPARPQPVSVETSAQSRRPRSPSSAQPSITATAVPEPSLAVPPRLFPPLPTPEVVAPPAGPATSGVPESTTGLLPGLR